MKSNEIKEKELKLKYEMEQLEKQHQEALVAEGKAYYCKTPHCKAFVDKEEISPVPLELGLCSNCYNRKWSEEQRQSILKKLKFAKIVDIELNGPYDIEQITVYKNGMLYDLKAEYDRDMDDNAKIVIDDERKDDKQHDLEEEQILEKKPWEKERKEKPLVVVH